MIYSRFGEPVTLARIATPADILKLDGRKPTRQDKEALKLGSYFIIRFQDGGEQLCHLAFLKADGGWSEISDARDALTGGAL